MIRFRDIEVLAVTNRNRYKIRSTPLNSFSLTKSYDPLCILPDWVIVDCKRTKDEECGCGMQASMTLED